MARVKMQEVNALMDFSMLRGNNPPMPRKYTIDRKAVGERIVLTREAMGMGQSEFARFVGLTPQILNNYEKGLNRPLPEFLGAICAATGAGFDWFYLGDMSSLPHDLAQRIRDIQDRKSA